MDSHIHLYKRPLDFFFFFVECHTFWICLFYHGVLYFVSLSSMFSCKLEVRSHGLISQLKHFWQEILTDGATHFVSCPTKKQMKSDHPAVRPNSVSSRNFLCCLTLCFLRRIILFLVSGFILFLCNVVLYHNCTNLPTSVVLK